MPPRKAAGRKTARAGPEGGARSVRSQASAGSISADATDEEAGERRQGAGEARTPKRVAGGRPSTAAAAAAGTRQVFTPLHGRRYARGAVEVPGTPVSRTPFTARRAIADYEEARDPIKTYVRLKPADPALFAGALPRSVLQVVSDKEVEVVRGAGAGDEAVRERYLFAGVLPSLAKQPRVFEVCGLPVVGDLFAGYNTLLFSYGITNSGKTYTVQGTGANPGLLPRSVKAILDVLDARGLQGDFPIRPRYATQTEYCSDPRIVAPTFRIAPGEDAWVAGLEQDAPLGAARAAEMARRLGADDGGSGSDWVYQLYVSYFEVYNEMVYDLLDLSTLTTVHVRSPHPDDAQPAAVRAARSRVARGRRQGNNNNNNNNNSGNGNGNNGGGGARRRGGPGATAAGAGDDPDDPLSMSAAQIAGLARTALLLRSEGGRGNEAFVDGVTEVRVRSVRDLVRVLIHGQMRRSVHATGLNAGSSRSHALFQAKLVRVRRDAQIVPLSSVPSEAQASVRTMTVVDLAGSERAKRTLNQGDRLAEAGKINVSLMTLKKCLDVRRYNAALDPLADAQLVPYNESKVTRLFQPALEGGAKTIMVVCIDPYEHDPPEAPDPRRASGVVTSAQAAAETKNVLDFARVASSLVTAVRRVSTPPVARPDSDDDDDDEEDEIFFDTQPKPRRPRKRAGSVLRVDAGVQTDDAGSQTDDGPEPVAKRQRRGLGGDWQHPSPRPEAGQSAPRTPAAGRLRAPRQQQPMAAGGAEFSFEVPAERLAREGPVLLSQALAADGGAQAREVRRLREALGSAQAQLGALAGEREAEADELVAYAGALEAAVAELRAKYVAAQERVLRIEEETRAETSRFFIRRIAQLQAAAADRLHNELALSELKAAHKIDILSRLRTIRGLDSDDDDDGDGDGALDAAEVPTVSPRTALRRAVSRAASKKANKVTSVSAGENREIANLRTMVESLEAQVSSQATQLEMINQARAVDRSRNETLETALAEANCRATSLEAKLLRLSSAHSAEAELAITRAHEQERAEFLAQITMLKAQLRDAETHSMRARRKWETQELLPVQERLRMVMRASASGSQGAPPSTHGSGDAAEALERAERDRDNAWEWWTREQERNSQLCAQNDVLMREIRHLRGQLHDRAAREVVVHAESMSDSDDDSFCKVSLKSIDAISAINGGNPIGASIMDAAPSQSSFGASVMSGAKPMASLDRVLSKGRVLHRNINAKTFAAAAAASSAAATRDSADSFAASPDLLSPGAAEGRRQGRAKRVVSKVFHNLAPGSKRRDDPQLQRPYMAGRFATTDTAVGSYAKEILTFEDGRERSNTLDPADPSSADQPPHQSRLRSIVYSGPMIKHATGGVSVTFTSQEVHDLALGAAEPIPEQPEDEDLEDTHHHHHRRRGSSPLGTKRTREMAEPGSAAAVGASAAEAEGGAGDAESEYGESTGSADELPTPPAGGRSAEMLTSQSQSLPQSQSQSSLAGIPSVASLNSTVKKKRKLHAARTVTDIEAPDTRVASRSSGGGGGARLSMQRAAGHTPPAAAWMSSPSLCEPGAAAAAGRAAAQPQETKQPVLFTPVRARAGTHVDDLSPTARDDPHAAGSAAAAAAARDKQDSIFTTPMKMLSRLRNRKK
ncbi:hypothetical protein H4R18_003211 [Coemansia javaensis]|uniref:Kinesin motor domain-containing protein n=1 Tax=Coemansia javaensis TaxID=2761396 RepID=A0A9W8H9J1_9FUNG|nr:hypothetical protein H4R18_003211 [Coemansia javaensis]